MNDTAGNPGQENDAVKIVSITEAARINNVTRQAIYVAIKQKKLKATKDATRWTIHLDDLEEYRQNKYSRTKSMFNGELLFDNRKGYYSVNQAAKLLNVPAQKIYTSGLVESNETRSCMGDYERRHQGISRKLFRPKTES